MNRSFRLMLSRIAFLTLLATAFGSLSALAQDNDDYGTIEMGDQPTYPGIPPKGKVEGTLGNYNLRVYGTALLNIHTSDAPNVGGEIPLWALPGAGRTTFIDGSSERTSDVHDLILINTHGSEEMRSDAVGPALNVQVHPIRISENETVEFKLIPVIRAS